MKCLIVVVAIFCVLGQQTQARTSECLKVKLPHGGELVGRHLTSHSGRGIRAFMGIPYAETPVDELRFRAPVSKAPWKGVLEATKDGPLCSQRDPFRRDDTIVGSEDCLHLNVYTPQFPLTDKPLPVMVFFHGGGWQCGSGVSFFYGPDFILDHDVIYIGANFRLGPLGFLSTGQKDCPGNSGLKDQTLILHWIQENIASFGGDPKQVTVFGESAGGASGTYHMMSPMSKGLFQRVISQSGVNLNPWAQPAHVGVAAERAQRLGEMMGCKKSANNWANMIDCLRKVPAENITAAFYDFFEWDTDPMIPFPPVVEPDLPGAFITVHPRDVKEPHGIALPWIAGLTTDEGALKTAAFFNTPELYDDLKRNWRRALPISLFYNHHEEAVQNKITDAIEKFYFGNKELTEELNQNLTNLYSDGWFFSGIVDYVRTRLESKRSGPTYLYLFGHAGQASFTEIFKGGRENYYGVCHAEELLYLFPIAKDLFFNAAPSKDDTHIREMMIQMWVNFATYGEPTPAGSDLIKWKATNGFPLEYLRIGHRDQKDKVLIEMEQGLMDQRDEFWRQLKAHESSKLIKEEL